MLETKILINSSVSCNILFSSSGFSISGDFSVVLLENDFMIFFDDFAHVAFLEHRVEKMP